MSASRVAPALAGNVMGSTMDSFAVAEWCAEGGPPGAPRYIAPMHVHHHDDEAWYVLEGTLCVLVGEETVEAPARAMTRCAAPKRCAMSPKKGAMSASTLAR